MVRFLAIRSGKNELAGTESTTDVPSFPIRETDRLLFAVDDYEPDTDYRVHIGDADGDVILLTEDRSGLGCDSAVYFDSCRGVTPISLQAEAPGTPLRMRALVTPSKLSEEAYEGMIASVQRISAGLLLDLLGRSRVALGQGAPAAAPAGIVTAQLEFGQLLRFWSEFSSIFDEIVASPARKLSYRIESRLPTRDDRVTPGLLPVLARAGVDPRRFHSCRRTLPIPTRRFSIRTVENRTVATFLALLQRRIEDCAHRAERQVNASRRVIDDYRDEPEVFKFLEREEGQRMDGVTRERRRIDALRYQIACARESFDVPPLSGIAGMDQLDLNTEVFANHSVYARAAHCMRRYIERTGVGFELGDSFAVKSTAALFEQWTYFQILDGLHRAGYPCISHRGVYEPLRRDRFTIDLETNAEVEFEIDEQHRVSLRYEPTILPKHLAGADTIFQDPARGRRGASQRPDILIEVRRLNGSQYDLVHATVVDAKYRVHDAGDVLDTIVNKYGSIRSRETGLQIVRLIWVAVPKDHHVSPSDSAVLWSVGGEVTADPIDTIPGVIGLGPEDDMLVEETVDTFLKGMINLARRS